MGVTGSFPEYYRSLMLEKCIVGAIVKHKLIDSCPSFTFPTKLILSFFVPDKTHSSDSLPQFGVLSQYAGITGVGRLLRYKSIESDPLIL